jgi:hypothetical protein
MNRLVVGLLFLAATVSCSGGHSSSAPSTTASPTTTTLVGRAVTKPPVALPRPPVSQAAPSLRNVDWANSSFPARVCGGVGVAVLHKGAARFRSTRWPQYAHVKVSLFKPVAFGDIDGDGKPEAAVELWCDNNSGMAAGLLADSFVIYKAGRGTDRTVLGILHTTEPGPEGGRAYFARARIKRNEVSADEAWYGPYDPTCCPSGRATTVWTYDGTTLHAGTPKVTVKPLQREHRV